MSLGQTILSVPLCVGYSLIAPHDVGFFPALGGLDNFHIVWPFNNMESPFSSYPRSASIADTASLVAGAPFGPIIEKCAL